MLALVPQDIVIRWKLDMLRLKKEEIITDSVIDQKRANVLQFAAQKAIALDRQAIDHLTLDQIAGLGDAAREGQLPAFVEAARALGLEMTQGQATETAPAAAPAPRERPQGARRGRPPGPRNTAPAGPPAGEEPPPGEAVAQETTAQQTTSQPAKPPGNRVKFDF